MTNDKQKEVSVLHSKKEMKKVVREKLQTALPEMKFTLGEKKFNRRLKKALKMLMHGIHTDDVFKKAKQKINANKSASAKKITATKARKAKAAMPKYFQK